jgi:hypothetical protein
MGHWPYWPGTDRVDVAGGAEVDEAREAGPVDVLERGALLLDGRELVSVKAWIALTSLIP